jgi:hypothetical protein
MNNLEPADLEVRLTFPEGDDEVAAQLTMIDRKSQQIVARINMTSGDLANFLARRSVGSLEGTSELLNAHDRAVLNKDRTLITVHVPFVVDVFEEGDSRHLVAWAEDAVRGYNAHGTRIARKKTGYSVSLLFFHRAMTAADRAYMENVQLCMDEKAKAYAAKAREVAEASKKAQA